VELLSRYSRTRSEPSVRQFRVSDNAPTLPCTSYRPSTYLTRLVCTLMVDCSGAALYVVDRSGKTVVRRYTLLSGEDKTRLSASVPSKDAHQTHVNSALTLDWVLENDNCVAVYFHSVFSCCCLTGLIPVLGGIALCCSDWDWERVDGPLEATRDGYRFTAGFKASAFPFFKYSFAPVFFIEKDGRVLTELSLQRLRTWS